jgi:threonine dehydrogenase-like Zn-dependent dehydrogenase
LGESRIAVNDKDEYFKDGDIRYPIQLGHKPIGIVAEVGKALKGGDFQVGDYITGPISPSFAYYATTDLYKSPIIYSIHSFYSQDYMICAKE